MFPSHDHPGREILDRVWQNNPALQGKLRQLGVDLKRQIKQDPSSGQEYITTTYPSGKIETQAIQVGRSPESIARAKEFQKSDAKFYDKVVDESRALDDIGMDLDELINTFESNPDAKNVTGPINKYLATYFGSPEQQQLVGRIATPSGNITLNAAKSIRGAFTGRDQTLINAIKPNLSDPAQVFMGKLKAMKILNKVVRDKQAPIVTGKHYNKRCLKQ